MVQNFKQVVTQLHFIRQHYVISTFLEEAAEVESDDLRVGLVFQLILGQYLQNILLYFGQALPNVLQRLLQFLSFLSFLQ